MSNPQEHETVSFTLGATVGATLKKTGLASFLAGVRSVVAPPDDVTPALVGGLIPLLHSLFENFVAPRRAPAPPNDPHSVTGRRADEVGFYVRYDGGEYIARCPFIPDASAHAPTIVEALAGIGREYKTRGEPFPGTHVPPPGTPPETSKPS